MARADLLVSLVRAGAQGDRAQVQKTVEAIAAEERAKKHDVLADRLMEQLQTRGINGNGAHLARGLVTDGNPSAGLVMEKMPIRRLEDLTLPPEVAEVVRELTEEQHRADLLRSYNLEPRNRVLLTGPPGNGKTSLAEALAFGLHLPLFVVRYEAVIGSYLGETARRISQVFEHARSRRCVLFFDEFDSVGKERGDTHETGEIKRVVSSLLLQIDALPSHVVIVTASNHPELLDRAAWRRFQIRLELPMPTRALATEWFVKFQKSAGRNIGIAPRTFADKMKGVSFAELEDFGSDVLRQIALREPGSDAKKITAQRLSQWKRRMEPAKKPAKSAAKKRHG